MAGALVSVRPAGPSLAPGFDPVSVFVEFGHTRIRVAIANINVVVAVKSHIGRSAEVSIDMNRRRAAAASHAIAMKIFWLVRTFGPATEI